MKKPKVVVVMPAYNAAKTLERTILDFPQNFVSKIILVDDGSYDNTVALAKKMNLTVFEHTNNLGYGANQKTCYWEALKENPDAVVMIHPDYQYDSSLLAELVRPILEDRYDMMYGNRIRTRNEVLLGGMPLVKYVLNRFFCVIENIVLGANFSEYFSGMRAFSGHLLKTVPFQRFSNDFVFDQQIMFVAYVHKFRIGEIDIPVRYFNEASSIRLLKGGKFLFDTILLIFSYILYSSGLYKSGIFRIKHEKS